MNKNTKNLFFFGKRQKRFLGLEICGVSLFSFYLMERGVSMSTNIIFYYLDMPRA